MSDIAIQEIAKNWNMLGDLLSLQRIVVSKVLNTSGLDEKGIIDVVINYIKGQGYVYSDELIKNFYLSLKSKPFVILAGVSGTGKSKLVKLFADAIGAEYRLISVRPDWADSSDLFGHTNLGGNFVEGKLLQYIREADTHKDKSYLVCLDEMNLARVEYYFSDVLSVIETRRKDNDKIVTDVVFEYDENGHPKTITLPENLYIIGTVNMDETTFPFSKKVLDRANTIEFSEVNFQEQPSGSAVALTGIDNTFLKSNYCNLLEARAVDNNFVNNISSVLTEINKKLTEANLQIGYRVRDEICYYMLNNHFIDASGRNDTLLKDYEAFAYELLQKILPRIQGSGKKIRELLDYLEAYSFVKFQGSDSLENIATNPVVEKYREKIKMMLARLESDDYTSYWL